MLDVSCWLIDDYCGKLLHNALKAQECDATEV
jgi:hypothetical protein